MIRAFVVLSIAASACGPATSVCGETTGTVAQIVDGDTIELTDGRRIRYLLVDTPETTGGKNDCFGEEAKTFNSSMVSGRAVTLKFDEASCTDRFGRLLAYVSVDGQEVNQKLVQQGYACTLFIAPAGTSRQDEFETYESEAKTSRIGLWGACTMVECDK